MGDATRRCCRVPESHLHFPRDPTQKKTFPGETLFSCLSFPTQYVHTHTHPFVYLMLLARQLLGTRRASRIRMQIFRATTETRDGRRSFFFLSGRRFSPEWHFLQSLVQMWCPFFFPFWTWSKVLMLVVSLGHWWWLQIPCNTQHIPPSSLSYVTLVLLMLSSASPIFYGQVYEENESQLEGCFARLEKSFERRCKELLRNRMS